MESLTAGLRGERPAFCHACRCESPAVHPDGTFYSCGRTPGDTAFISQSLDSVPDSFRLLGNMKLDDEHCRGCDLEGRCPSDCPSRLYYNQGQPSRACDMYRTLYEFRQKL